MKMIAISGVLVMSSAAFGADFVNDNGGFPATGGITYTVPGAEGSPNVLLYNDRPLGVVTHRVVGMELGLQALGLGYTFTNSSVTYSELLGDGGWDLVMQGHNGGGGPQPFDAGIAAYIAGGGQAVINDWRTEQTYDGITTSVPTNNTSMMPVAGSRFADLFGSTDSMSLGTWDVGWGRFNVSLVGGSGEEQLVYGGGTTAGRIGDGGNTFIAGFIDDTIGPGVFDPALASDVYAAMILTVPEPTTMAMLVLGGLGVLRRRQP